MDLCHHWSHEGLHENFKILTKYRSNLECSAFEMLSFDQKDKAEKEFSEGLYLCETFYLTSRAFRASLQKCIFLTFISVYEFLAFV